MGLTTAKSSFQMLIHSPVPHGLDLPWGVFGFRRSTPVPLRSIAPQVCTGTRRARRGGDGGGRLRGGAAWIRTALGVAGRRPLVGRGVETENEWDSERRIG